MTRRARPALLALPLCLVSACESAHAHEHALIDHEYDRREQLVDRLAGHAHEILDHGYERQLDVFDHALGHMFELELGMFERMLELGPPDDFFGPDTRSPRCTFTSEPSGAEVFELDIHDRWRFVGETPLEVERPLLHAVAIEVRAEGRVPARGYMLSDRVLGPCAEHFVLAPVGP